MSDVLDTAIHRVEPLKEMNAVIVEMMEDGGFVIWVQRKKDDTETTAKLQEVAQAIYRTGVVPGWNQ